MDMFGENPRGAARQRVLDVQAMISPSRGCSQPPTIRYQHCFRAAHSVCCRRRTTRCRKTIRCGRSSQARSTLLRGWDYRWRLDSSRRRWPCSGARRSGDRSQPRSGGASTWADDGRSHRAPRDRSLRRLPDAVGSADARISAAGTCRGARSTASSATTAPSSSPSTMRTEHPRCRSPPPAGARSPRSGPRAYPGTKRWYGTSGNSFVAVVEFGPRVRALAVTAGGESGHPESPHFNDQAAALRRWRSAPGLLLSRGPRGPHRAQLPPRAK